MQWLAAISVKRPVFASVLIITLTVIGAFSFTRLGLDRFPKVDFPTIVVTTRLPGAAPEEVETEISDKIEEAVNTISGIDELRSTSSEGISTVIISFLLEKDVDVAAQEVRDRVNRVLPQLPRTIKQPTVEKFDPDSAPVMTLAVSADKPIRDITEYADKTLRRQLESVNGVGQVVVVGGRDCCVIFDGGMERRELPALSVATRGLAAFNLRVQTGERDLHSGMYGNAAMNAIHALLETLGGILPRGGRVPEALRVGIAPVTAEERAAWEQQPAGVEVLRDAGAVPYDPEAAEQFYLRTTAEPSVEVNGVLGGKPGLKNTTVVSQAQANFTVRLAPGQDPRVVAPEVKRLLHEAAPEGATVEVEELEGSTRPGLVDAGSDVVKIAQDAFETAFGVRPILTRSGGTLPIMPALADKGIPTILTGFALPESNVHSPNERMLVDYFPRGITTIKELYTRLGDLATS